MTSRKMLRWISNWWKLKQHKTSSVRNGSKSQDDAYEHPATVIRTDDSRATEAEYREHDRQYKDRQISTNRLIALFTFFTAAVGIWQGFLTRRALHIAQENSAIATQQMWSAVANMNWVARSMDSNSKTAQTALSVSEQRSNAALDQMKQSNRFSREALVSVQRAFVVFGYELLANGVTDPTGRRLRRGNFGPPWKTPAVRRQRNFISTRTGSLWSLLCQQASPFLTMIPLEWVQRAGLYWPQSNRQPSQA